MCSRPVVYLKKNCPWCLKLRLFLLEADLIDSIEIRDFSPNTQQEQEVRAELGAHLDKVTFPAAQMKPGFYMRVSDDIIAYFAAAAQVVPKPMPAFKSYVEGVLKPMLHPFDEDFELKSNASEPRCSAAVAKIAAPVNWLPAERRS